MRQHRRRAISNASLLFFFFFVGQARARHDSFVISCSSLTFSIQNCAIIGVKLLVDRKKGNFIVRRAYQETKGGMAWRNCPP